MRLLEILILNLTGLWQAVRQDFNLLELAAIAVAWMVWLRKAPAGWRPSPIGWPFRVLTDWCVSHPSRGAALLVAGTIALRLALLPVLPVPVPFWPDEFSHLLLADTLLHGRLANPTHPFWQHFESLHIIQLPHYASNYFPGQAAFLAAGQWLFASAWAGVLAGCAFFLAALYWALRGWMPARWALFGVLLAAIRFGIASYWINAYHGGFVPAAAGALIFGAYPRLTGGAVRWQHASLLGLGLAILAATRPYEGVFYALPVLAMLAWKRRTQIPALLKIALPVAALSGLAVLALMVYLRQVTGSPFVTAYQISQKTYGWPAGLAWTPPPRVHNRHIEMARYYEYEVWEHGKVDSPLDFLEYLTVHVEEYWRFFFGPVLSLPLLWIGSVWRRRRILFVIAGGAVVAVMLEGASSPHYLAPAAAVLIAILVECCRHVQASRWRVLVLLPAAMIAVLVLRIGFEQAGLPFTQQINFQTWCCRIQGYPDKPLLTAELARIDGSHLVFVEPKTNPRNDYQWIYNGADLDGSRFVWARDMGDEENARLASYMNGRHVWLVDPNTHPATLEPYDPAAGRPEDATQRAAQSHAREEGQVRP